MVLREIPGGGAGNPTGGPKKVHRQAHVVGEPGGVPEVTRITFENSSGPSCVQLPPVTDKPAGHTADITVGANGIGDSTAIIVVVTGVTGIRPFRGLLTQVPFS